MLEINLNKRQKYGSAKDKAVTINEAEHIIKELKNPTDRAIFILGFYAGLRVCEIAQIRSSWIKWEKLGNAEVLLITIPDEARDNFNNYKVWCAKSKTGRTTYIFNQVLGKEIEQYFIYNNFINLSKRNISEYRIKKIMGKIINRKISAHCLRAGSTYQYSQYGLNRSDVAYILGHKDTRTTDAHYTAINKANTENSIILLNKKEN